MLITIFTDNDYYGSTYIRIPARESSVSFYVKTNYDHIFESNESFTIIANIDGYTCETNVIIMDKSKLLIYKYIATYIHI